METATAPEEVIVSDDAGEEVTEVTSITEDAQPALASETAGNSIEEAATSTPSPEDVNTAGKRNRISAKDRIAQLTAKNKELERQNSKLQEPNPGDFEDGEYSPEYRQQQIQHAVAQELQARDTQQAQQKRESAFSESLGKAAETYGEDKVNDAFEFVGTHITNEMADVIKQSGNAGELIVQLAGNPDQLATIQNMSPIQAAMHIGQMTVGAKTPAPKSVTNAPPPPSQVGSNDSVGANLDDDSLSVSDYEAAFRKKHGGSIHA